jgi:hypothetical protein
MIGIWGVVLTHIYFTSIIFFRPLPCWLTSFSRALNFIILVLNTLIMLLFLPIESKDPNTSETFEEIGFGYSYSTFSQHFLPFLIVMLETILNRHSFLLIDVYICGGIQAVYALMYYILVYIFGYEIYTSRNEVTPKWAFIYVGVVYVGSIPLACAYLTISNKLNEKFSVRYGKGNYSKHDTTEYSLMQDENLLNDELRRDCYFYNKRREACDSETENNSESPLKEHSWALPSCQNIHNPLDAKGLTLQSCDQISTTLYKNN